MKKGQKRGDKTPGMRMNQVTFRLGAKPDEVRRFLENYLSTHPLPPGAVPPGYEPVVRTTFATDGSIEVVLVLMPKAAEAEMPDERPS